MMFEFSKWLRKDEVATGTDSIAGFQRPLMGIVRRMWAPEMLGVWAEEDPFFKKKKKERINEACGLGKHRKIPDGVIKIHLPNVQQTTNFSCGAAVTQAICFYYGVGPDKQEEYMKKLGTKPNQGTAPADICDFVRKYGLQSKAFDKMSFEHLKEFIDQEKPVICAVQAYGSKKDYKKSLSGHYVVAIGYDKKHIYFEDPSSQGRRTYLPIEEFEDRWHDADKHGTSYHGLGIVIWKRGKGTYLTKAARMD